jgi:hypothetical protein
MYWENPIAAHLEHRHNHQWGASVMIDGRTVQVDPAHAARVVHDFADRVGLPVKDRYSPDEMCQLLRWLGYDVTPGVLEEFTRKGYVSDPGDAWDVVSVYTLAAALESRRRWLPTPCHQHDSKKSGARLLIEQAARDGVAQPIQDLDRVTIEDLLLQLVANDARAEREVLFEAIRLKLSGFEE